ncbi:MAG TPA: glycogen-binding domain-containing protein [Gemmatimonadaceae bacterium]|nr:glycogen-binding domain-containing protein [Gemmatimonadaceae bacterium]
MAPSFQVVLACLMASGPAALHAQSARGSLDLGSSIIRYADSIDVNAIAISPAFRVVGSPGSLGGAGTLAQASGFSSLSGFLYGTLASSFARPVSIEVGSAVGGSTHSDRTRTGQMLGTARLYLNGSRGGAWGGGGLGRTWDGELWRSVVQGTAGAWTAWGWGSAVLSLSPTAVDDTIRYTDALVTLNRRAGILELTGSFGARVGDPVPSLVTDRTWGSVSIAAWWRPTVAVVASGGTYPVDFTQGFPGGRYLTVALRLATPRPLTLEAARTSEAATAEGIVAFQVESSGSVRKLRVRAPSARSVELAGDFTKWDAVALSAEGNGWWSVSREIPSGTHQVSIRVDGRAWVAPPGLVAVRDEFGGSSGLLVVK